MVERVHAVHGCMQVCKCASAGTDRARSCEHTPPTPAPCRAAEKHSRICLAGSTCKVMLPPGDDHNLPLAQGSCTSCAMRVVQVVCMFASMYECLQARGVLGTSYVIRDRVARRVSWSARGTESNMWSRVHVRCHQARGSVGVCELGAAMLKGVGLCVYVVGSPLEVSCTLP